VKSGRSQLEEKKLHRPNLHPAKPSRNPAARNTKKSTHRHQQQQHLSSPRSRSDHQLGSSPDLTCRKPFPTSALSALHKNSIRTNHHLRSRSHHLEERPTSNQKPIPPDAAACMTPTGFIYRSAGPATAAIRHHIQQHFQRRTTGFRHYSHSPSHQQHMMIPARSTATEATAASAASTSPGPGSSSSTAYPAGAQQHQAEAPAPAAHDRLDPTVEDDVPAAASEAETSASPATGTVGALPALPALPAPSGDEGSTVVEINGTAVALDRLGPMVIGRDGTVSRISNWAEMADIERKNTLRILGKRNQLRLANLRGEDAPASSASKTE